MYKHTGEVSLDICRGHMLILVAWDDHEERQQYPSSGGLKSPKVLPDLSLRRIQSADSC